MQLNLQGTTLADLTKVIARPQDHDANLVQGNIDLARNICQRAPLMDTVAQAHRVLAAPIIKCMDNSSDADIILSCCEYYK